MSECFSADGRQVEYSFGGRNAVLRVRKIYVGVHGPVIRVIKNSIFDDAVIYAMTRQRETVGDGLTWEQLIERGREKEKVALAGCRNMNKHFQ